MNKSEFIGRLTTDGDMKFSPTGTAIYKNRIAVDRKFKKEGEPTADFFTIKLFGKAAETFQQWTQKGSKVFVTGPMLNDDYTDKDGNKHYGNSMLVDEFEFLDPKSRELHENDGFANVNADELPFS